MGLGGSDDRDPDKDCREVVDDGLGAVRETTPAEGLGADDAGFAGAVGGPIEVLPVTLRRDLVLESDVRAVVAGVIVRGVEVAELAEETALVGDLVGDCDCISFVHDHSSMLLLGQTAWSQWSSRIPGS